MWHTHKTSLPILNRPVALGEESGKGDRIQQTPRSNSASVSDHEGI